MAPQRTPADALSLLAVLAVHREEAQGLTLLKAENAAGYFGVTYCTSYNPGPSKPYQARG